jgi:hypothetical protein
MLVMRSGLSIGSLLTGMSVSALGLRHALLINGVIAAAAQIIVGREWIRSRLPKASPPTIPQYTSAKTADHLVTHL